MMIFNNIPHICSTSFCLNIPSITTSLEVQCLKLHASNAGSMGSIPGWEWRWQMLWGCGQKKTKHNIWRSCWTTLNHNHFPWSFQLWGPSSVHLQHIWSSCLCDNPPKSPLLQETCLAPSSPAHTRTWSDHYAWSTGQFPGSSESTGATADCKAASSTHLSLTQPIRDTRAKILPKQVSWCTESPEQRNEPGVDWVAHTP